MKWINIGDIKTWANQQRHCQQTLPELVRRLILATANNIEEIDFPSGDSIATSGWDGRLNTSNVTPFFPSGMSGWEIGAGSSPQKKADEDYDKRTADPLCFKKNETTFVFVTPRSFANRSKWENDKRSVSEWKDVRVINIDKLDLWLENAPAVALWFARQINKVMSSGIRDLEAMWDEWSIGTKPVMTPELVIGGRTKDAEEVQAWVSNQPSTKEVQGDHPEEALAFLYASIATLPEAEKAQALARCVVVENISELRQLTEAYQNYPLIIAAPGESINAAHAAISKGHHVYISMDATVVGIRNVLRLSRPQRGVVEKILHESGMSESDSQRIARDSGRSIPVLRRHLFQAGAVNAPSWADAKSAQILLPVLFANAWDERKDGDCKVIETLTGDGYDDFIKKLTPFLLIDDSPVRKVGSVWMIKSPLDAWFLLNSHFNQGQLELFKKSLLSVLTKTDPKYDLEPEKRWAASMYRKSNPYSEWLRTGLVESLVLITVFDNPSSQTISMQIFADNAVKDIIAPADRWESWASISDATPLLAEAAPNVFLEELEQKIAQKPDIFQKLMSDDTGGVFGECRHSGLLWALEGLAWSTEYFTRAVNILFALAKIDTGGKWGNRAINSLKDIFTSGCPQTHAKPKDRLTTLDSLISKNSQLVWKFTQSYYHSGSISESHRLRWRDTGGQRRGLEPETNDDYREYVKGLLGEIDDLACAKENIVSSVDNFISLPSDLRTRLIEVMKEMDSDSFSKDERAELLSGIRKALNWINSYGKDDIRELVPELNRVLEKFTPDSVIERVGWLLSTPWPRLPQGEPKHHEGKDAIVKKAQKEAVRDLLDNASIDEIIEFARSNQYPGILGLFLAVAIRDREEDIKVLDAILKHTTDMPKLIMGYAQGRVEVAGNDWIERQIEHMKSKGNYSSETCAYLYLGLPEGAGTWSAVSKHGEEVETAYWKQASGYSRTSKGDDTPIAIEKLLDVKRPDVALELAGDPKASFSSAMLQRLLKELLTLDEKKLVAGVMDEYYLGHVFNQLYEKNDLPLEELAKLEWPFAPLFDEFKRYTSLPMAIHRLLQKDPHFFAELCFYRYKRDDRKPDPAHKGISKEKAEMLGHNAYSVLDSWHLLPGLKDGGTFDEKELIRWVDTARKKCAENKRVTGCDIQIGFLLAHAPVDADGVWPHTAVRKLIEHLNNKIIDEHIQNKIYNSRGVVSRGLNEGGTKERTLVEKYSKMSDALKTKWPRTATILRNLAETYKHEAKRVDIDSDLHDLRWD